MNKQVGFTLFGDKIKVLLHFGTINLLSDYILDEMSPVMEASAI